MTDDRYKLKPVEHYRNSDKNLVKDSNLVPTPFAKNDVNKADEQGADGPITFERVVEDSKKPEPKEKSAKSRRNAIFEASARKNNAPEKQASVHNIDGVWDNGVLSMCQSSGKLIKPINVDGIWYTDFSVSELSTADESNLIAGAASRDASRSVGDAVLLAVKNSILSLSNANGDFLDDKEKIASLFESTGCHSFSGHEPQNMMVEILKATKGDSQWITPKCLKCEAAQGRLTYDLNEVEIQRADESRLLKDFYTVQSKRSSIKYKCKVFDIASYRKMSRILPVINEIVGDDNSSVGAILMVASVLLGVYDKNGNFHDAGSGEVLIRNINKLPRQDLRSIIWGFEKVNGFIDYQREFDCIKCKQKNSIPLLIGQINFLFSDSTGEAVLD